MVMAAPYERAPTDAVSAPNGEPAAPRRRAGPASATAPGSQPGRLVQPPSGARRRPAGCSPGRRPRRARRWRAPLSVGAWDREARGAGELGEAGPDDPRPRVAEPARHDPLVGLRDDEVRHAGDTEEHREGSPAGRAKGHAGQSARRGPGPRADDFLAP